MSTCLCVYLSVCLPVCERGDDQPVGAAQVLVAVDELHVGDVDDAAVRVLLEVEARLLLPLEVQRGSDVHAHLTEKSLKGGLKIRHLSPLHQ